ncbi:lysylphosphatidylglycerol synthase domain-containing protein [Paenibacillus cisolokensis]|uniref:lysylphosphatidylglycerol synthase domain-containing protein n=1 Tax=Paenibacillus cisolokensis TaxID=1658519 RepID=UPI003D2B066B
MGLIFRKLQKRDGYIIIFILFITLGLIFTVKTGYSINFDFVKQSSGFWKSIILFTLLYLAAHLLRIIRLYTILLENKIKFKDLLRVYAVTAWVNFFIPYKVGEIFRVIEIGRLCKNVRRGIVVIWIERLFDAIVILTIMLVYFLLSDISLIDYLPLVIILFTFISFSFFYYLEFPFTYKYVNQLIMSRSNSTRGVKLLNFLYNMRKIHSDIKALIQGRSSLGLFISVIIWILEIFSISILFSTINISSMFQSFFLLLNDSFFSISTSETNSSNFLLYKNLGLIILSLLALYFICSLLINRISEALRLRNKQARMQYVRKNTEYY